MKLATFVFSATALLVNMYGRKYMEDDKQATLKELEKDYGFPRIKTYDFIIVGGGTAGCVVAGRLSEKFNVLLLESGGNPVPQSHSAFHTREVSTDSLTNFIYKSVPQRNYSLWNGGIVNLETGKMLGGSGSHNDMGHQRGSPLDWDNYASLTNDPSWRYENILQFFKKSETFIGQLIQPEQASYYGTDGPLTVDTHYPAFMPKWLEAGLELGFPSADPNGLQIESFAPLHKLIDKGGRVSTYNRYVKPFEGIRTNLTVIRYASVTQILLDKSNKAYGVAYLRHGIPQIAHASNEVVLSAGSIISPLILMMSGIGPSDVLQEANIPLKVSSPQVGKNLADHVFLYIGGFSYNSSATPYLPRIAEEDFEDALNEYLETGEGEFGELQEGPQAFYVSSRAKAAGETTWPDARTTFDGACPMSIDDDEDSRVCFFTEVDRPQSRGSVTLNISAYASGSTDFVELAEIDFNAFSVSSDLDVMIEVVNLTLRIVEDTRTFQSMGFKYVGTVIEGCDVNNFHSDPVNIGDVS